MTSMTPHRASAQIVIAFGGMLGCILAGLGLHLALGTQGRDPTAGASLAALLLALLAAFCVRRGYGPLPLFAALGLALLLSVGAIGFFAYGGLPRLDRFFLSWFSGIGLLLAVPWLLGLALGLGWRRASRRTQR